MNDIIIGIIEGASKYPTVTRVGVFGSYARGEQTTDSDIDIIYDYSDINPDNITEILDYGDELITGFREIKINVDFVSLPSIMQSINRITRKNILDEVVWVYQKPVT
ncbi:MAG: nucleotidyltransferase domain-containing protein [Clostridiales bacterium]|jgi:predicted nucleotidyltransferase|nr:nucleotidyltransferase domain-containing protein [Clostridiales bacterium]